jgi:hypothetical protein
MSSAKPTKAEREAAELEAAEELEAVYQLAALGQEYTLLLHRQPGHEYLDRLTPDMANPETIREKWGGGRFTLKPQKNGQFFRGGKQVEVRIAGVPKDPTAEDGELAQLRSRIESLTNGAKDDGSGLMLQMMTTFMTPILTAVLDRKPENSAVEILSLARELAKDQRGAADDGNPYAGVIKELGVPLLAKLNELTPAPAIPAAQQLNPPAEPVAPPPTAAQPDTGEKSEAASSGETTAKDLAERLAAWLAPMEARNADPELRAELFLEDMQGSELLVPTLDVLHLENALDLWAQVVPRVAENRDWYGRFIAAIRTMVTEEDDGPKAPDGGSGDVDDGPDDGEPSDSGSG